MPYYSAMLGRAKPHPIIVTAASGPLVCFFYFLLAYAIRVLGCTPAFADTDFLGINVTVFLLAAITVAALVLIVFNGVAAARARRSTAMSAVASKLPYFHVLILALPMLAFAVTLGGGVMFLRSPCP